jgi:hypothetical protein
MIRLITILLFISIKNVVAQPGPFGGYDMSFTLIDKTTNTIIDFENKNFKVFPTHYYEDRHVIVDTFKYDLKSNRFYYIFNPTPVGPAIPAQFTINVISGMDTMKIYFAEYFIGDTLHFQKGEFIATNQYLISKSIGTFNSTKVLNNSIYDFELSKLTELPYYNVEENSQLKLDGLTYSIFNSRILSNKEIVSYGIVTQRVVEGNMLSKGVSGSYSFYANQTSIDDKGIAFSLISNPGKLTLNYNYETLDTILGKIDDNFSLLDKDLKMYFPNGLNWQDTNSVTFAILANLQIINDTLWTITLNQSKLKRQIFISKDKGINWEKSFSINSDLILDLRSFYEQGLCAFTGNKIYYSKNYGKSWSNNILGNNTMNIVDLMIVNDTVGFLLNQKNSSELIKFSPKTGEYKKILDNIGCCYYERDLKQRVLGLYYYNNAIVIRTSNAFIVSNDLGLTWTIINNDCIRILKNSTLWTWYKGVESKEIQTMNYGHYYPSYYRCDKIYLIKSLVQAKDNKLMGLCYYNQDGVGSPHIFAELKLYGLNERQKK